MTLHSFQPVLNVEKTKNNNFTCIKTDRMIYIQASNYVPPFKRSRRATKSSKKRLRVNLLYAFDNFNFLMLRTHYTHTFSLLWNYRFLSVTPCYEIVDCLSLRCTNLNKNVCLDYYKTTYPPKFQTGLKAQNHTIYVEISWNNHNHLLIQYKLSKWAW